MRSTTTACLAACSILVGACDVPDGGEGQVPSGHALAADEACQVGEAETGEVLGDPALSKAIKLTSEGNYHGERGDLDTALKCFRRAISTKAYVPAYLGLAVVYRERAEYERALQVLESARLENASGGQPLDFSFEIAFYKVSTLLAEHQHTGERLRQLIGALEEARRLADQPFSAESKRSAEALGIDLEGDRRVSVQAIDGLLAELGPQEGN